MKILNQVLLKLADFRLLSDILIPYYVVVRGYPTAPAVIFGTHGYEIGREAFHYYVQTAHHNPEQQLEKLGYKNIAFKDSFEEHQATASMQEQ